MSYTQEQLTALKAAVAKGIKSVTTDGNTVVYASTSEMLQVISVMERQIATSRPSYSNPTYSKGI